MGDLNLQRDHKVLIYVLGLMEDLIDKGLITGPKRLSEKAQQEFKSLEAEGFEPTGEEMRAAMEALMAP